MRIPKILNISLILNIQNNSHQTLTCLLTSYYSGRYAPSSKISLLGSIIFHLFISCIIYPFILPYVSNSQLILSFGSCCGLNFCVPGKIHMLNPNAQCGSIRKWGLWEMLRSWGWNGLKWLLNIYKSLPFEKQFILTQPLIPVSAASLLDLPQRTCCRVPRTAVTISSSLTNSIHSNLAWSGLSIPLSHHLPPCVFSIGLQNLINKTTRCPVNYEFHINNK